MQKCHFEGAKRLRNLIKIKDFPLRLVGDEVSSPDKSGSK